MSRKPGPVFSLFAAAMFALSALFASTCSAPDPWNPADPTSGESIENSLIQCLVVGLACTGYASADPAALSSLVLWLRADNLTQADGTSVAAWSDSSGNGHGASQATGGNQPTYIAGTVNGLPVVRFTAANMHHMTMPEFMDSPSATIFHVLGNIISTGSNQRLFNDQGSTANEWIFPRVTSTDELAFGVRDSAGNAMNLVAAQQGNFAIHTGQVSGPSIVFAQNGADQVKVNGAYSTLTTWQGSTGPPTIGGNSATPTNDSLSADIAEIIVFNRALSTDERRGVQCYLSAKYGILLSHGCM